jgi:hypothetical protein
VPELDKPLKKRHIRPLIRSFEKPMIEQQRTDSTQAGKKHAGTPSDELKSHRNFRKNSLLFY